jgi:hypothetical protein
VLRPLERRCLNGASRFPEEIDEIERQGLANFRGIREAIERHGIDAEGEETGYTSLARRPHQLEGLARAAEGFDGAGGVEARLLDRGQAQAIVRSPVVIGGLKMTGGSALIHPAKLAWGLRDAVIGLGARVCERTPVRGLDEGGADLVLRTDAGSVRARRVVLATNAFPPLIGGVRSRIVPVYDHVLMTEPLTPAQREAIGWTGREGLGDAANRFHYFRLSADERILWGGYDATYHFGEPDHARLRTGRPRPPAPRRQLLRVLPAAGGRAVHPPVGRRDRLVQPLLGHVRHGVRRAGRGLGRLHGVGRGSDQVRGANLPGPRRWARDRAHGAADGP